MSRPDMPDALIQLLPMLQRKGSLTNGDVRKVCNMSRISAVRLLNELVAAEWLKGTGKRGAGALYSPGPGLLHQAQISSNHREADTMTHETDTMKQKD